MSDLLIKYYQTFADIKILRKITRKEIDPLSHALSARKPTLKEIVGCKFFQGWQGIKCPFCGATHNILRGESGLICNRCAHFINVDSRCYLKPFRKPDFGWNRSVLQWAYNNFGQKK